LRQQFEDFVNFEAIPVTLSDHDEAELKSKYYNDNDAQMLLRAIVRLGSKNKTGDNWVWAKDGRIELDFDDIKDDLEQEEIYPIPDNKVLRDLLKQFVDHALLTKKGKTWFVPKRSVAWLLNLDLISKNREKSIPTLKRRMRMIMTGRRRKKMATSLVSPV
jgi:hypothetical protein